MNQSDVILIAKFELRKRHMTQAEADFKMKYSVTCLTMKTVKWSTSKKTRQTLQWNKVCESEISPSLTVQLLLAIPVFSIVGSRDLALREKERVPFATPGNGSLQWASRIDASAAPKHAGKGPPVAMATVRAAHDVGGGGKGRRYREALAVVKQTHERQSCNAEKTTSNVLEGEFVKKFVFKLLENRLLFSFNDCQLGVS
ncbi:hypothetical protein CEXT_62131 [Caerostris extrusa]|uniref:Uncharacterized protein n=1 Tax=Caerostris extrusa TaxID=172846 RepID=A0AAV4R7X8_CAEEX|nr:hypothetical protein CEXT_62131 [Caerostris extrusa]